MPDSSEPLAETRCPWFSILNVTDVICPSGLRVIIVGGNFEALRARFKHLICELSTDSHFLIF